MNRYILLLICSIFSLSIYSQKKTVNIGVLSDVSTKETIIFQKELIEEIKSVVGEDALINFFEDDFLVNNQNIELAEENYRKLVNKKNIDLILAFGYINSSVVIKQTEYPKPTFLLGTINQELINIDSNKKSSKIKNLTYFVHSASYKKDLEKFKELTSFTKVGIAIEKKMMDNLDIKTSLNKILNQLKFSYKIITYTKIDEIFEAAKDIDAIYMASGLLLTDNEIKTLAQHFINEKIPVFTTTGKKDVINGLYATNQPENLKERLLRRIALSVEAFINGTQLSELPVLIKTESRLTINYTTSERIGQPIKYSLIKSTDFVGDIKNTFNQKSYNLLSAIEQMIDKNLSLASQKKDLAISQQDVKSAKSSYLPYIGVSATGSYLDPDSAEQSFGQNPEYLTEGNITLEQVVLSPSISANLSINKEVLKAEQESLNTLELDLVFDVANAYFQILIFKINSEIQIRNLNYSKTNLRIAQQNFEAGKSGKSDVLRLESEIAQNTQTLVEAINLLEQGYINLNQLLNNPTNTKISIEDVNFDKGFIKNYKYDQLTELLDHSKLRETFTKFLIEEANKNAPELKNIKYNLSANKLSEKLYRSGRFLPTISFQAQYTRNFSRNGAGSSATNGITLLDKNYSAGLNISIPVFNQNQNNINQKTAVIKIEQLEIEKKNFKLNLDASVRNNVLNITNEIANIELSEVSEKTAKESLELNQASYSQGAVSIIQLLDAQTNYLNAQQQKASALYNFLINSLQLERSIGYYFLLNSEEENERFRQRFFDFSSKQQ